MTKKYQFLNYNQKLADLCQFSIQKSYLSISYE